MGPGQAFFPPWRGSLRAGGFSPNPMSLNPDGTAARPNRA